MDSDTTIPNLLQTTPDAPASADDIANPPYLGHCPDCNQIYYTEGLKASHEARGCEGETGVPVEWDEIPYGATDAPGADAVHEDDYKAGELSEDEILEAILGFTEVREERETERALIAIADITEENDD